MQLIRAEVPENYDLVLAGDTHEGNVLKSSDGIRRMIQFVSEADNRFLVHMGDWIEAITVDDKRYDSTATGERPAEQRNKAIELFSPIKDRIICGLEGNHGGKLWKYGNLEQEICEGLGTNFGTYTAKITFADSRGAQWKLFASHGYGTLQSNAKDAEQQIANMKATLKMRLKDQASDCAIMAMGHTHKLLVVEPVRKLYMYDDGRSIKQGYTSSCQNGQFIHEDFRWYANTGSFLRQFALGVSGYAERKGYKPVELGYIVIEIRDRKIMNVRKETV